VEIQSAVVDKHDSVCKDSWTECKEENLIDLVIEEKSRLQKFFKLCHSKKYGKDIRITDPRKTCQLINNKSFRRLEPSKWLNDEVINYCGMNLVERNKVLKDAHKCLYMNTFFLDKLLNGKSKTFDYTNVERWTKKVGENGIFGFDVILIANNVDSRNSHWTLIVVYMQLKRIRYLDACSLVSNPTDDVDSVFLWMNYEATKLHRQELDRKDWDVVTERLSGDPKQSNGYDCGLYLILEMECIIEGKPIPKYGNEEMGIYRRRLAFDLMTYEYDKEASKSQYLRAADELVNISSSSTAEEITEDDSDSEVVYVEKKSSDHSAPPEETAIPTTTETPIDMTEGEGEKVVVGAEKEGDKEGGDTAAEESAIKLSPGKTTEEVNHPSSIELAISNENAEATTTGESATFSVAATDTTLLAEFEGEGSGREEDTEDPTTTAAMEEDSDDANESGSKENPSSRRNGIVHSMEVVPENLLEEENRKRKNGGRGRGRRWIGHWTCCSRGRTRRGRD